MARKQAGATPANPKDAATKDYVDTSIAALPPVQILALTDPDPTSGAAPGFYFRETT